MEIHASLKTQSKLFCDCPNDKTKDVNINTCPICLGHPGSKPSTNKEAVKKTILVCKALNTGLREDLVFSRKNYFYPDLSKNYQITQYEEPLGENGFLEANGKIRIKRVHLEEDPASITREEKNILIDYNRSGTPLVEIVTEPDIKDSDQARLFMKKLLRTLKYLRVLDENSSLKADVNVSNKKNNYTRVEVKNVTGFKEIQRCIEYEIKRQEKEKVISETRGWDAMDGETYSMRKKESEADYGYIYEPDIPIINIKHYLDLELPILAEEKVKQLTSKGIDNDDAEIICDDPDLVEFFEKSMTSPVFSAKIFRSMILGILNYNKLTISEYPATPNHIKELLELLENKVINEKIAKKILIGLLDKGFSPKEYVKKNNLEMLSDENISSLVDEVLKENEGALQDYLNGEEKSLNFLVGMVMKKSKGKANPEQAKSSVLKKIKFLD